jgi:FkbM family methyltransferase
MLIPFKRMPVGDIRGIIHIGAHEAEELHGYSSVGISKVLWVEANPLKWQLLADKISPFPDMALGRFAAAAVSNQEAILNVASNGQSSSILQFGSHQDSYPNISFVDRVLVDLQSVDDWIDQLDADRKAYNFVNIDIQGYELEALRGMRKQLEYVDYVYTEINTSDVYKDCAHVVDLDKFLGGFGFSRVATKETNEGWGDAFYSRKNKSLLAAKFKLYDYASRIRGRLYI